MDPHHRRWAIACLFAAVGLCAPLAAAQDTVVTTVPDASTTTPPPLVTVQPVEPTDPGIVTPPIVVPANPPPANPPPTTTTPPTTQPLPPPAGQTTGPDGQVLPPPATDPDVTPAPLPEPAATEGVADPGWTQVGYVPTARPLREGDMYAQILGYMGAFGIQYGINGDADISGGLSFFTLELAAKYSFYHNDYMAISAFAEIAFPFYKGAWPMVSTDDHGVGSEYIMFLGFGPLFSLWNDIAELDVGLLMIPALQWPVERCLRDTTSTTDPPGPCINQTRPFDTDLLVMPYVYGSIGLAGFARLMLGFEHFAVTGLDNFDCPTGATRDAAGVCRDAAGTVQSEVQSNYNKNIPALMLGVRLHGERFVADITLHFPMSQEWWSNSVGQYMVFIPTVSFGYLW
jgi:hypothetical protein